MRTGMEAKPDYPRKPYKRFLVYQVIIRQDLEEDNSEWTGLTKAKKWKLAPTVRDAAPAPEYT